MSDEVEWPEHDFVRSHEQLTLPGTEQRPEDMVELDLDGHVDDRGIRYIGKAIKGENGKWICLANVGGCLCRVEVTISLSDT